MISGVSELRGLWGLPDEGESKGLRLADNPENRRGGDMLGPSSVAATAGRTKGERSERVL